MNCRLVRRRMLMLERPELPPDAERGHLLACADCRSFLRELVAVEHVTAQLPAPPSSAKEALVRALLTNTPVGTAAPPPSLRVRLGRAVPKLAAAVPAAVDWQPLAAAARRRARPLLAGAAALLVFAAGVWALRPGPAPLPKPPEPTDPLLAAVLRHDLRLAAARSPRERLETLAGLADDLHEATQTLAPVAAADRLNDLAGLYRDVVRDGIVAVAGDLPAEQRQQSLGAIADRLARACRESDRLADEVTPEAAAPLRAVAEVARAGDLSLRDLAARRPGPGRT